MTQNKLNESFAKRLMGSVALRNRVDETMTGCPAAAVPGTLIQRSPVYR